MFACSPRSRPRAGGQTQSVRETETQGTRRGADRYVMWRAVRIAHDNRTAQQSTDRVCRSLTRPERSGSQRRRDATSHETRSQTRPADRTLRRDRAARADRSLEARGV